MDRAIQIVEVALKKFGSPVYVRHEIVHNKYVVDSLKAQGAVFVEELNEVPEGAPVVFSANGVPKSVPLDAQNREMIAVDATCPLVSKVHREAERHHADGRQIILIGHVGHPEVIGTMGQLPEGAVVLVEDEADVAALVVADPANLAYCTQTTLSVAASSEGAVVVASVSNSEELIAGLSGGVGTSVRFCTQASGPPVLTSRCRTWKRSRPTGRRR